jgi:hypothetical protein
MDVGRHRRFRIWVLWGTVLPLVILGLGPRAFGAPRISHGQAPESRRPKSPRHIAPSLNDRLASGVRQGERPEMKGLERGRELALLESRRSPDPGALPSRVLGELSKPEYLKAFRESVPLGQTSPPA